MTTPFFHLRAAVPLPFKTYLFSSIGNRHEYTDPAAHHQALDDFCTLAFQPVNEILLGLSQQEPTKIQEQISVSVAGPVLAHLHAHRPAALHTLRQLLATGRVQLAAEPPGGPLLHALAPRWWLAQWQAYQRQLQTVLGQTPRLAVVAEGPCPLAYATALAQQGCPHLLIEADGPGFAWPLGQVTTANPHLSTFFLSHFDRPHSPHYPLTGAKLRHLAGPDLGWLAHYAWFGQRFEAANGPFSFLEQWLLALAPAEPPAPLAAPAPPTWAAAEAQMEQLLANQLQKEVHQNLQALRAAALASPEPALTDTWANLLDVSLFAAMQMGADRPASLLGPPYDVYINCMNILSDLKQRLGPANPSQPETGRPLPGLL
jgi:hypothetical protein